MKNTSFVEELSRIGKEVFGGRENSNRESYGKLYEKIGKSISQHHESVAMERQAILTSREKVQESIDNGSRLTKHRLTL